MRPCKAKGVIGLVALQRDWRYLPYFFHLSVKRGRRVPAQPIISSPAWSTRWSKIPCMVTMVYERDRFFVPKYSSCAEEGFFFYVYPNRHLWHISCAADDYIGIPETLTK